MDVQEKSLRNIMQKLEFTLFNSRHRGGRNVFEPGLYCNLRLHY